MNVVVLVSDARGLATVESLRTDPGDHENVALPSTVSATDCPLQIVMSGPAEIAGRAPILIVASRSIVLPDASDGKRVLWPDLKSNALFERSFYADLYESVLLRAITSTTDHNSGAIIFGSP